MFNGVHQVLNKIIFICKYCIQILISAVDTEIIQFFYRLKSTIYKIIRFTSIEFTKFTWWWVRTEKKYVIPVCEFFMRSIWQVAIWATNIYNVSIIELYQLMGLIILYYIIGKYPFLMLDYSIGFLIVLTVIAVYITYLTLFIHLITNVRTIMVNKYFSMTSNLYV